MNAPAPCPSCGGIDVIITVDRDRLCSGCSRNLTLGAPGGAR